MALPNGPLGQASAAQAKPPVQAGGKFDAGAVQAENIETISQAKAPNLRDVVSDELGDQREALNSALLRMRASLDDRKNRMFDPVLMQAASGFLKPTKTGSFGESLGYAAEGAGVASERQLLRDAENQKMEMELLAKEQELRKAMGSDRFLSSLLGRPSGTAPAPAGGAVTTPTGALRVPGIASPVDAATTKTAPTAQQVVDAVKDGRVTITDELMVYAEAIDPKLPAFLDKIRKAQIEEEKNQIEREKSNRTTRTETPRGTTTPRAMDVGQYDAYQKALNEYLSTGDEQKYLQFLDSKGWLDFSQARGRKIPKAGEQAEPISPAKSASEQKAEEEMATQTAKERATSAEQKATRLASQAEAAFANMNTADDMIGYAKNNPKILEAMNQPGIFGAVKRAAEQGIKFGDFSVSVPAKTLSEANLTYNDLAALQIFAQKYAELQNRGRQLTRTPGEGSTSDYETKLLGSIYALPTDSQRAVILKSDALKLQSIFDEDRFKLWNEKSKQSGYTYNDFLVDNDYKRLKGEYRKTLDRVREENLDLLTPKKKEKPPTSSARVTPAPSAPPAPAPAPAPTTAPAPAPAPVVTTPPATQPPANETYSQRLRRLQAEAEKQKRGG